MTKGFWTIVARVPGIVDMASIKIEDVESVLAADPDWGDKLDPHWVEIVCKGPEVPGDDFPWSVSKDPNDSTKLVFVRR